MIKKYLNAFRNKKKGIFLFQLHKLLDLSYIFE